METTALTTHMKRMRPKGAISLVCLTAYLLCGATAPQSCQSGQSTSIGPSGGEVIAAAVGVVAVIAVGTVVLVEVHKSHHTVKGCVSNGPNGFEVTTDGDKPKTYMLEGNVASIKPGDLVRFHGDKVKKTKDSTADQTFTVQKINKDYGPCKIAAAPVAKP
jgi:hypothetical protein